MVVKLVASKGSGSFSGLGSYILDKSHDGAKVVDTEFTNCPYSTTEKNLSFIKKMQDLNQSAKSDKTMHLIVSFREGEIPSKDTLRDKSFTYKIAKSKPSLYVFLISLASLPSTNILSLQFFITCPHVTINTPFSSLSITNPVPKQFVNLFEI